MMDKEIKIKGYWWLPENPDKKIAGILRYRPNELPDLQLFDDFVPAKGPMSRVFAATKESSRIILGEDVEANKMTLTVLWYVKRKESYLGFFSEVHYNVQYFIKGMHLNSTDDNVFKEIEIDFGSLTNWLNSYLIRHSIAIKDGHLATDFTLSYSRAEKDLVFDINDDYELSIIGVADHTDTFKEEITVRQKHIISIKSAKATDFLNLLEKCYRFQAFLNMATFTHNEFLAIRLYSDQHFLQLNDGKRVARAIEFFFKQGNPGDIRFTKDGNDYLFGYETIKDSFAPIIKKWFGFNKKIMPILHHLMDSIQRKPVFKSVDFLIVVQALEGFHHRFIDREPEKDKQLPQRLKNLISTFEKDVVAVRKINIKSTVDSRNYYSHFYNKEDSMRILEGTELRNLTEELRKLLVCCFLRELGVDNYKINDILEKV